MLRPLFAATAAVALLAGCAPQGSVPAAAAPSQTVWGGQRSCTTSSAGVCTLPHDLGVIPDAVSVSLVNRSGMVRVQSKSATTVTVLFARSIASSGAVTPWASVPVTAEVVAVYTPPVTEPTAPASSEPASQPTTAPPASGWPNPSNTGTPAGWTPATTRTTDLVVSTPGALVQDVRLTGGASVVVRAANVTLRRVELTGGGTIDNVNGSTCYNGLTIEDSAVLKGSAVTGDGTLPAIGTGGYTARRVKIQGWPEGFRVGGRSNTTACGPVTIESSWAQIRYPDNCIDWHGDGVQGYDGAALTVTNTYLELVESASCGGTAPFFYPGGQGNVSAAINGLIVKGGGFSFRLGTPGSVQGLRVVDGSWSYGPVDVSSCAQLTAWQAVKATVDANYQPTDGATIPCG